MPAELDVHLILDNYATHKTPAIRRWLAAHPRFHLHFTPTGASWLNLVERWFAELTARKLRRGAHRSVRELNADIRDWLGHWNDKPTPLRLDQDRRPDPQHTRRILPTNYCVRTLASAPVPARTGRESRVSAPRPPRRAETVPTEGAP